MGEITVNLIQIISRYSYLLLRRAREKRLERTAMMQWLQSQSKPISFCTKRGRSSFRKNADMTMNVCDYECMAKCTQANT